MSTARSSVVESATSLPTRQPALPHTRLLLEGPIVPTLLRLAAPNVVVNVLLIVVTATVDAYFVGRLGAHALAGISLVFPFIMLMQQVANSSMGGAVASAVARAIGGGRHHDASALVIHALIVAVAMAALFAIVMLVGGPAIYRLSGGSGEVLEAALAYSNALFAGSFAYWVLGTLTSVVRGAGQAAILAWVYLAAEALHIILVPALMSGAGPIPPLGITGAGAATVASFTASSIFLAWYIASGRTAVRLSLHEVRLTRRLFVEILRVGAPMSLQPLLTNLSLVVLTGLVATLGTAHLAAFGVASRLEYLLYPLAFGLGAGVLAMVGTNLGAGNLTRAARAAWTAAAIGALVTGCLGVFGLFAPDVWARLFTEDSAVRMLAGEYLVVIVLAYPLVGAGATLGSAFQAGGRPFWPLVAITSRLAIVALGGWAVLHLTDATLGGFAVAAGAGLIVSSATLIIAFYRWQCGQRQKIE